MKSTRRAQYNRLNLIKYKRVRNTKCHHSLYIDRPISFPPMYRTFLIGVIFLLGGLHVPAAASPPLSPDSSASQLYVPNQRGASVSVLDQKGAVLTTVDLTNHGFSSHAMPHQVIAGSDSSWYVTLAGAGVVAKFDRQNELVAKTNIEAPGMIALDRDRNRVYVSRALSAVSPPTSLAVLRASDLQKLEDINIFVSRPHALAVDSITGHVYSASLDGSRIASFAPASEDVTVTNVEDMSGGFVGLDTSPDGTRLVATTQRTDELLAFDTDTRPLDRVASVSVSSGPYDVRFSPDGNSVWFPNQDAGAVTRVNANTWTVASVIEHEAFVQPHGVAISSDTRTVYISNHGMSKLKASPSDGSVAVIDAVNSTVRRITKVGPYAAALGLGGM